MRLLSTDGSRGKRRGALRDASETHLSKSSPNIHENLDPGRATYSQGCRSQALLWKGTSCHGTGQKSSALRQSGPVTEALYPTDAGAACSWPDIDIPVGDCAPVSYTVVQWIDDWAGVGAPLQPYLSANLILVQTQRFERGHARWGIPLSSSRRRGLWGTPWCVYRESVIARSLPAERRGKASSQARWLARPRGSIGNSL
jgi:hypothetical protein